MNLSRSTFLNTFAALGIVAHAMVGTAHAADPVFFTPTTLLDNGSNLVGGSNVLTAVSFTNPARVAPFTSSNPPPNPVINGITFTGIAGNGSNTYFTSNGAGLDSNRASGRPSTAAIYPLIYDATRSANNSTNLDLTLRNLTIGSFYNVQLVFSSGDANRNLFVLSGASTSAQVNYGTTNGPKIVTATFTADATTQVFTMTGLGLNNRSQLSGFVLTAAPEPGTLAFLALGGTLVLARRRRK
jgi:hypothetical protein